MLKREGEAPDHAGLGLGGGADGIEFLDGGAEFGGARVELRLEVGVGGGQQQALQCETGGKGFADLGAFDNLVEQIGGVGGLLGLQVELNLGELVRNRDGNLRGSGDSSQEGKERERRLKKMKQGTGDGSAGQRHRGTIDGWLGA